MGVNKDIPEQEVCVRRESHQGNVKSRHTRKACSSLDGKGKGSCCCCCSK